MSTSNLRLNQREHLQRQHDRSAVLLPAIVERGSKKAGARIINMAAGGALIQCSASFRPGEAFLLRCGSIAADAVVVWQDENLFGIAFRRSLSEAELAEQLYRNRAVESRKSLKAVQGHCISANVARNRHETTANISSSGNFPVVVSSHRLVEAAMRAVETIMVGELSDVGQFSLARLQLRQANLARTKAALEACDQLMAMKPSQPQFRDLQRQELALSRMVSEHVQSWPTQRLQEDWPRYRRATSKIFARVRELIAAERKLLLSDE